MHNKPKGAQKKVFFIVGGIAAALLLCGVIAVLLPKEPVQLRSDCPGIDFIMEGDRITCVEIRGQFPYLRVFCPLERNVVQDEAGCVKEKIYTYTMQAEPALLGRACQA